MSTLSQRQQARQAYASAKKSSKLGSGKRFAALVESARLSGARNPAAVAAMMGRKAHGATAMKRYSAMGRK